MAVHAEAAARVASADHGFTYVSPYNDPGVIAGQGTIGVEIAEDATSGLGSVDVVIVSVGGGGLISGVATAVKHHHPDALIIGVSPENDHAMIASVNAGRIIDPPARPTFSDGTAGAVEAGAITFQLCTDLVDRWMTIDERSIAAAVAAMIDDHHELVEGSAGVALAAATTIGAEMPGANIAVVSCGANVSSGTVREMLIMGRHGPGRGGSMNTVTTAELKADLEGRLDQLSDRIVALAEINSGSFSPEGVNRVGQRLADMVGELDPDTVEFLPVEPSPAIDGSAAVIGRPVGDALRVVKRGDAPFRVCLFGHLDTVFSPDDPFQTVNVDGHRLHGPGVADCKGGLVLAMEVLRHLDTVAWGADIGWEFLVVPDEEIGSIGSKGLLQEAAANADLGLGFEPALPSGGVAAARKGSLTGHVVVRGVASHVGRAHDQGRSAILGLAELIATLEANNSRDGVTVNCGKIVGGGALNVVPDLAIGSFNMRVETPDDQRWIEQRFAEAADASPRDVEVVWTSTRPPKVRDRGAGTGCSMMWPTPRPASEPRSCRRTPAAAATETTWRRPDCRTWTASASWAAAFTARTSSPTSTASPTGRPRWPRFSGGRPNGRTTTDDQQPMSTGGLVIRPARADDAQAMWDLLRPAADEVMGMTSLPSDLPSAHRICEETAKTVADLATGSFNMADGDTRRLLFVAVDTAAPTKGSGPEILGLTGVTFKQAVPNLAVKVTTSKDGQGLIMSSSSQPWTRTELDSSFIAAKARGKKLGTLLSRGRFMLLHLVRSQIPQTVASHLRGRFDADGSAPFWRCFGAKFAPRWETSTEAEIALIEDPAQLSDLAGPPVSGHPRRAGVTRSGERCLAAGVPPPEHGGHDPERHVRPDRRRADGHR